MPGTSQLSFPAIVSRGGINPEALGRYLQLTAAGADVGPLIRKPPLRSSRCAKPCGPRRASPPSFAHMGCPAMRNSGSGESCTSGLAHMMSKPAALLLTMAVSLLASAAVAEPLEVSFGTLRASPLIADCVAHTPAVGRLFEGTVLQVIDGQTLCVAQGPTPSEWIRVTIAGAPQDSRRETLMAASFGRVLGCLAVKATPTGVEARCEVNGAPLDQLIATDAARRQGQSWR